MRYSVIALIIALLSFHSIFCQSLTTEQLGFLKKNAIAIYTDSLQKQSNWSALSPHIKNKKIILIGEFTHGAKEIFDIRNALIKYVHRQTGAKVILFESGIGELITANINKATMSAAQMTNGLFGPWRTKEFVELMEYVKTENISIAGFDVQRTGGSFTFVLNEIARKYTLDTTLLNTLESRYTTVTRELSNRNALYDSLKTKTTALMLDYQKAKTLLSGYSTKDAKEVLFAGITIDNRIHYLRYMLQFLADKDWNKRWAARDSAMTNNTQWLLDNIYPNQPIIIIGHNFHVGKHNENETVMGELLKTKYNNDMYSIGIFAGAGSYSDNFGKEVPMTPQDTIALDMKHVINHLGSTATFLHIAGKLVKGSEWLNHEIVINDTFIDLKNSNKMILSKTFDALILLKRISPAKVN